VCYAEGVAAVIRRLVAAVVVFAGTCGVAPGTIPQEMLSADVLPYYNGAKAKVLKNGWTCMAISGEHGGTGFAYTVGLSSKGLPELSVFEADDTGAACTAIALAVHRMLETHRTPRDGAEMARSGKHRLVVRAIYPDEFFDRCIFANVWRREHHIADARGMQLITLDDGERLPR
jgi:hypothetical protein